MTDMDATTETALAEQHGVSIATLRRILAERGLAFHDPGSAIKSGHLNGGARYEYDVADGTPARRLLWSRRRVAALIPAPASRRWITLPGSARTKTRRAVDQYAFSIGMQLVPQPDA